MCRSGDGRVSRGCLSALSAVVLVAQTGLSAPPPVSLAEMLCRVSERSNAARVATIESTKAREVRRELHSAYLPRIELGGGYTVRDSPMVAVFGAFAAPFGTSTFWQYQLTATELLWDGGRRRAAVESADPAVAAADCGGTAAVVQAQLEGVRTYLGAVLAHRRRVVVSRRIDAIRSHLEDARNLYEQGMVARNDLLEARVRLRSVEDRLPDLQDAVSVAGRTLARLMGLEPDVVVAVPADLPPAPELPGDLESLSEEALQANPAVKALEARMQAARGREEARRAERMPEVVLQASHTYEENPYLQYEHANIAMLGLRWSLFDGGQRNARTVEARLEAEQLAADLEEARRTVTERLDAALRAVAQARREAATARENVAAAEENLRIVTDQYQAGLARGSDVLDAEALLADARLAEASRKLEIYGRQAEVLALTGRDLATFYGGNGGQ